MASNHLADAFALAHKTQIQNLKFGASSIQTSKTSVPKAWLNEYRSGKDTVCTLRLGCAFSHSLHLLNFAASMFYLLFAQQVD